MQSRVELDEEKNALIRLIRTDFKLQIVKQWT